MLIEFDHRESTSPYVDRIWRSSTRNGGSFLSMADSNIELVFTRLPGVLTATLRGPVSRASFVDCPANGEWLAIRFRVGSYLPGISTMALADHQNVQLPILSDGRFVLQGAAWEVPRFDSAEQFVDRLVRAGALASSRHTAAALLGEFTTVTQRSVQRHFRQVTGMTLSSHRQIQRARDAVTLLLEGRSLLDASFDAGYFDQAHLTRSLRDLVGTTPARLVRERPQLSFSYKTAVA